MTEEYADLGELPHGWIRTRLGEIAEVILGQSPPSSSYNEDRKGLPFYQGKLEFGRLHPTPGKWCTASKKIAQEGDVLISVRAPVGPTNVCPAESCIGRGLAAIRGLGGIGTLFILYLLRAFENEIARKGTGTTFSAIGGDQLKKLEIPLPPLNEQVRIVARLEELFARLDAGVEGLRKVKAQLKRYRQAVLKYAFEGKLTEERRKTHKDHIEPATKLLENIKQERKKDPKRKELPPINISNLSELPENWTWTRLGEIGIVASGGTPSTKIPEYFDGDVPWITPADLSDFTDKFIHRGRRNISEKGLNSSSTVLLPEGTILFSSRAPIGYVAIAANPVSTNQGFKNLILYKGIFNEYIFYYLKASKILAESYGSGTTFREVSAARFSLIPIPLAPLDEQHRIVEEIEQRLSFVDETQKTIAQAIRQSDRLRQSILKIAFEGRLVSQDPSDESAEKLLERIKEERAKSMGEKDTNRKNKSQLELSTYVE